jgi:hypothetical protein
MNWRVIAPVVVVLALGGVAAYEFHQGPAPAPVTSSLPAPSAAPAPSSIPDPLRSDAPAAIDRSRPLAENWVSAPPAAQFQYSRGAAERGGAEPCAMPAPDAAKPTTPLSYGSLFFGAVTELPASGEFDLVMHFNGEGPVRRELLASGKPFILYTFTLPPTQSYAPLFAGSGLFARLIDEATASVSQHFGRQAKVAHLALSAWSAGFEGVRSILFQPEAERIEAVMLIDGFHAPRGPNGMSHNLEPFVRFARRAEKNERWFVVTHSSIPTPGYTSTTESSHFLINELGGKPLAVRRDDGFGLELIDMFDAGALHVRGYAGNDKADHCAQLLLLRTLFGALYARFHA